LARRRGGADEETAADAESGGGAAWSGVISAGPERDWTDVRGEWQDFGVEERRGFFQDWARSAAGLSMQCVQGGTPKVAFQCQVIKCKTVFTRLPMFYASSTEL
jgi:hypothetical protein